MADFLDKTVGKTIATIDAIRNAETPGGYIRQRIQVQTDQLSNKSRVEGELAVANESLNKLAIVLYETVDLIPVNVDSRSYKILIPIPWGDSGYHTWGLRSTEARVIRWILMVRCKRNPDHALFQFKGRYWHLNANTYPSSAQAVDYLKSNPITMREWDRQLRTFHESEAARYQRRKDKKKKNA